MQDIDPEDESREQVFKRKKKTFLFSICQLLKWI